MPGRGVSTTLGFGEAELSSSEDDDDNNVDNLFFYMGYTHALHTI